MTLSATEPAPAAPDRSADDSPSWPFAVVAAVLAVALVIDQVWWGGFETSSARAAVVLAAFVVLARPSSVPRVAVLLGAEMIAVTRDLPTVGTHRFLLLIVAGTVLTRWTALLVRSGRIPSPAEAFAAVGPFLRVAMVVTYGYAALAKINPVFLDPATSCAVASTRAIAGVDPAWTALPAVASAAVEGTIITEVALAILLAVPRTRALAMIVGGGFHVVLALAGNVPFSAVALALYAAFLPADLGERLPRWRRGRPVTATTRITTQVLVVGALCGGWWVGARLGRSEPAPGLSGRPSALDVPLVAQGAQAVIVLLVLAGAATLALARFGAPGPFRYPRHSLRVTPPVLLVGTLVIVMNGLCPYLGLKTDTSFEMFSGLRTEPGAWNHLLLPESMRILSAQDGSVTVLAADDPTLVARTADGARIVPFELERLLRERPGSTAVVTDGRDAPRLVGPFPTGPTVAQRVATFRDVPPPGRPRC